MRNTLTLLYSDPDKANQRSRNEETAASDPLNGRRTPGAHSRQLLRLVHYVANRFDDHPTEQRRLLEHYGVRRASCVRHVSPADIPRYSQAQRFLDVDVASRYFVRSPPR